MTSRAGLIYERLVLDRIVLLWTHAVLALLAAFMYLGVQNMGMIAFRRGGALGLLFRALPAMIPYLISALYSRDRVSTRVGFWAFIATLLLSTIALGYWYFVGTAQEAGTIGRGEALLLQVFLYSASASICLGPQLSKDRRERLGLAESSKLGTIISGTLP